MPDETGSIGATTSFCASCGVAHAARYERCGPGVRYVVDCPRGPRAETVSSDHVLFERARRLVPPGPGSPDGPPRRWQFHLLEITDACDFECPLCYAGAGPGGRHFMSVAEAERLGRRIRERGGRWVSLTGGEPALHPELPALIAALRRLGLRPRIITNGLRIAEDAGFLARLAAAGLGKVVLQFDTFRPEVYRALRGRSDLAGKHRAIARIRAAGLRLGLVATLYDQNVDETGDLIVFAASLTPHLNTLILQAALPVGRYPAGLRTVTREDIVHAAARDPRLHLAAADFLPLPRLSPWGIGVHPDCGLHTLLRADDGEIAPLLCASEAEELSRRLNAWRGEGWSGASPVMPLWRLGRAVRPGFRLDALRRLRGLVWGKGRGALLISAGSYMHAATRDDARIAGCATCAVNEADGFVSLCARGCADSSVPGPAGAERSDS